MSFPNYLSKTEPFKHQAEVFQRSVGKRGFALLWEPGTGKTKAIIDEAAALWNSGEVSALLVLAPKHIHANWSDEVDIHLHEDIPRFVVTHWTGDERKRKFRPVRAGLMTGGAKLVILLMSYSAMMTDSGATLVKELLTEHSGRVLYVLDESTRIKNPVSKRSRRIVRSGTYARYRRILSGTPVPNGPFDLYPQMEFLYPKFWESYGIGSFAAFKTQFAEMTDMKKLNPQFMTSGVKVVTGWRNLEQLSEILAEVSSRVRKEDALDLPPKNYVTMRFRLRGDQVRVYEQLRDEYMADLDNTDAFISATNALTRLMRLQQITCGHCVDVDGNLVRFKDNIRLEVTEALAEQFTDQFLVFGRFRVGRRDVKDMLGKRACLWDGSVTDEERSLALEKFHRGDIQALVINQQIGGEGLTLTEADNVIFYSNMFDLDKRVQAEDRTHRIRQTRPVTYYDLQATGTVDAKIIRALRAKKNVASIITGDTLGEWIR